MLVATVPGQLRGEALGRADHRPGAHHAAVGAHLARGDRRDPGPLVDRHAAAFGGPRQPAHQPRRMDGRAVGGVRRAGDAVGAHDPRRRRGVEERQVVGVPAPVPRLVDLGPGARELGGAAGQPDRPALGDVGVDALGRGDPGDLVDGGAHRGVLGERGLPAAERREGGQLRGEQRRAPAPVAPGGAEAGHLGLEHGHGQRRVRLGQVVGGPEPGVAGSDDGHVDVEVAREGRSRRPVLAGAVVPERQGVVRRLRPLSGLPTSRSACAA